uniref:non-specific serine/threonine protein kinase n=1 Tax=Cacopsylla melanoneura TaxID=428564 RepID=A0A8D8ZJP0_9HEMI
MFKLFSLFIVICITITVVLLCVTYSHGETVEEETKSLPFCGEPKPHKDKSMVFVSTLDGHVSALNLLDGGSESWSLPTDPGPMLSSSIHRLELSNSGHWVRMIPSLSGGLYKFNGDNLEPIPITVDNLLEASFKYSEDVIISGGKESRSYGVDVETGKVIYECSMNTCGNTTPSVSPTKDMIILQRLTQTVRAVEPRTGSERWNFSVGQHDVKFLPDENSDCHHNTPPPVQVKLKVIVPEGLLCAMSKEEPGRVLWQHKFGSPIVNAWRLDAGQVEVVDLFGSSEVGDDDIPESPDVYVGMHNKQLYIQESVAMQRKIQSKVGYQQHLLTDETNFPRIPWRPIPATSSHLLGLPYVKDGEGETGLTQSLDVRKTTSLSILYASEYVNGNGYYLYSTNSRKTLEKGGQCDPETVPSTDNNMTITTEQGGEEDDEEDDDDPYGGLPVQIINIHMSFWYWWKEVLITSLLMAVAVNVVINKRLYRYMRYYLSLQNHDLVLPTKITPKPLAAPSPITTDLLNPRKSSESSNSSQGQEYVSRYLTDFEPVHCLGRGGFGVVFQAMNRIDDCDYAIKRITLRQESRDRVMREVKALAKLDHQYIVRYFNAWLECPPDGWQEDQDKAWKDKARDDLLSSLDDVTSNDPPTPSPSHRRSKRAAPPTLPPASKLPSLFSNNYITNSSSKLFEKLSKSLRYRRSVCDTIDQSDSVVFQHSNEESESESLSSLLPPGKGRTVPDDEEDSFIQFEASTEQAATHGVGQQDSVIDISSSSGGQSKLPLVSEPVRKRPNSLSICPAECSTGPSKLYLYIQMQLCRKDSLREWLADNVSHRDRTEIINIFEQIVQAVEYVHMQGLIHRDLKPSNIFFSQEGQIKVGDFGLVTAMMSEGDTSPVIISKSGSDYVDERHTAKVGTQLYMSPEQMAGKSYNYKVDIYSLGMIFFELLIPFSTQMERWKKLSDLRNNIYPPQFQSNFPKEYELLQVMLAKSPEKRATTYGIRARPPLADLHTDSKIDPRWHYDLPRGHLRTPSISKSVSSTSSNTGSND